MLSWQYRRLIILLILILQIFSSQLNVEAIDVSGLNGFRITLIVIATFLFLRSGLQNAANATRMAMTTCLSLFLIMLVSLLWTSEVESGLRQISYLLTLLSLIYTISFLIVSISEFKNVCLILITLGIGICMISYYEISSGNHFFESSIQQIAYFDNSLAYVTDNLAWFTFDNPNDLSVHLAVCCIFGIMAFRQSILPYVGYAMTFWIAYLLDARLVLAVLAAYFIMAVFSIGMIGARRFYLSLTGYAVFGTVAGFFALQYAGNLEALDVSMYIRSELILSAIEFGRSSYLVGIGAGSFETEMWQSGFVGLTYGIVNPHNAFARAFAETGILGLSALVFLAAGPIALIWRARLLDVEARILVLIAVVLPLLFSIGSDPMASSSLQLAIALLWVGTGICLPKPQPEPAIGSRFADDMPKVEARR